MNVPKRTFTPFGLLRLQNPQQRPPNGASSNEQPSEPARIVDVERQKYLTPNTWASHWRAQFLAAGQAGLKSRAPDARDDDHRRLQAKIGELLMETELLYAKVDQLEAGSPLARRRSTR